MKYFVILTSLIIFSCSSKSKDCTNFKTGTFKYANSTGQNVVFTRNDSIQIENDNKIGVKFTGSIEWLSNCKYSLTYTKVSNPDYNFLVGTTFNVEITSTTKNSYKYSAYDNTRKITGEVIKIE